MNLEKDLSKNKDTELSTTLHLNTGFSESRWLSAVNYARALYRILSKLQEQEPLHIEISMDFGFQLQIKSISDYGAHIKNVLSGLDWPELKHAYAQNTNLVYAYVPNPSFEKLKEQALQHNNQEWSNFLLYDDANDVPLKKIRKELLDCTNSKQWYDLVKEQGIEACLRSLKGWGPTLTPSQKQEVQSTRAIVQETYDDEMKTLFTNQSLWECRSPDKWLFKFPYGVYATDNQRKMQLAQIWTVLFELNSFKERQIIALRDHQIPTAIKNIHAATCLFNDSSETGTYQMKEIEKMASLTTMAPPRELSLVDFNDTPACLG